MKMEGHHHHHQQYNMATDLRQLVNEAARSSTHFPTAEQLFSGHRNLVTPPPPHPHQQQHYEMMMLMTRGVVLDDFPNTTTTTNDSVTVTVPPTQAASNIAEATGYVGGDASTGRWPRQETLSLLEIRSRLDPKFKEVNQKGPLWDEVSRMMYEEHGYQRSGKKCREKFENLYKYYKKTKEGKAGRHDGKHYRFFRQLEALYGENSNHSQVPSQTNNNNKKHCDSLSLTNSTDIDTSSSSEDNDSDVEMRNKRKRRSCWKVKIKDFIDLQMKKLVEKQEEWLEKLVKTLEEKEKERVLREEEWREQEARRLEREHKFWAKERAWIEARDVALMEALQNITTTRGINIIKAEEAEAEADRDDDHHHDHYHEDGSKILGGGGGGDSWQECEITRLQQLRSEILLETNSEEEVVTWERVANKMACFGYERSALMCKEKWESIISHYNIPRDDDSSKDIGNSNKKRIKENSSRSNTCFYFNNNNDHQSSSIYNNQGSTYCDLNNDQRLQTNNGCCSSPSNSNVGNVNAPGDTCFQFLMSDGGNLWENYGLKINKVNQNH